MDMDEMMENEDFAQDGDFHNMYPTPSGFSTNDPVNDWERDAFFDAEVQKHQMFESECTCSACTGQDNDTDVEKTIVAVLNFPTIEDDEPYDSHTDWLRYYGF